LSKYSSQMSQLMKNDEYVKSKSPVKMPFLAYNF
jgi:hypothetical protein